MIHKILKVKIKSTYFVHRIEDWIVHSIKTENGMIYEQISDIKNCIKKEIPKIEFRLRYFDPLKEYQIIESGLGPNKIILPPEDNGGETYFNYAQLNLVLTD